MRRFLVLLNFMAIFFVLQAQKATPGRAYNYFYEKNYAKAKEVIDQCITDEKWSTKAQTWLYKGNIDLQLAYQEYSKKQDDNNYQIQTPNIPVEAYDAFTKALSLNKNIEGFDMDSPSDALPKLYPFLLFRGVELINQQQYQESADALEKGIKSYEMKTPPAANLEGELYYYYAFANEMLQNTEKAIVNYEKAINDGAKDAPVYVRLIEAYKSQNKQDKILEVINIGKSKIPNDPTLAVTEIDHYHHLGNTNKVAELLKTVPSGVYSNIDALTNLANIFLKDTNYMEATTLLKKAIVLNPNNPVVVYNLGVCYYSLSESKFNQANKLDMQGNKQESLALKMESTAMLDDAQRYFEQYTQMDGGDLNTLYALRRIYIRKNDVQKIELINQKISELENK